MSCHASPLWLQHLDAVLPKLEAQNFPCGVYLVATPIGNLFDITLRALHVLEKANIVVAEDTRRTRLLLKAYGLSSVVMSYHDHNWEKSLQKIIDKVRNGQRIAVVSDAGTPLIADPGFRLVMQCRVENIPVFALPGPSSVLTALTVAGIAPYPFHFFGFLPSRGTKRHEILRSVRTYSGTLVFFESPQRLQETLQDALEVFGPRLAVVARELTKKFEEVRREPLDRLVIYYEEKPPKGEIVLLVTGSCDVGSTKKEDPRAVLEFQLARCSVRDAVRLTHEQTGWSRAQLYRMALGLQEAACARR